MDLEAVHRVEISAGYFDLLGIPILRGREFDLRERQESQRVAIVNDQMARKYFPKADPVGKQINSRRWMTKVRG